MPRSRLWLAAVAISCLGCLNLFRPWLQGEFVGNTGDGRWNMYLLEHHYKVLTDARYPGTYSSAPFWVPDQRNNIAYSDLMAAGLPLYLPARLFLSRDLAFQFFLLASTLANFAAFLLLAREAGALGGPALAAAAVYGFGATHFQHLGHTQFALLAWGVLGLWSLLRFLRLRQARYVAGCVLGVGLQAAVAPYAGYLLALGVGLWLLLWAATHRAECASLIVDARRDGLAWVGAATLGALVPLVLLTPYWRMLGASLHRQYWEVKLLYPAASFWLKPLNGTPAGRLWSLAGFDPNGETHGAGWAVWITLGLGLLLLWRSNRAAWRQTATLTAAGLILLALVTRFGAQGDALWHVFYNHLPGADGMRDLRRISMAANPLLLLAASLALSAVWTDTRRRWLLPVLAVLALAENAGPQANHCAPDWYAAPSDELRAALRESKTLAAFLDPAVRDCDFNYNLQLLGQELNVPVINGSSGRYIAGFPPIIRPADVAALAGRLSFAGLSYLVPRAANDSLQEELRDAGFTVRRTGTHFVVYTADPDQPAYHALIRLVGQDVLRARPGQELRVPVVVTNQSSYLWQTVGELPTQVLTRIDGVDAGTTDLPAPVRPGGSTISEARVKAPAAPGEHRVRLLMIRQRRAFFESEPPCELRLKVE